MKSKTVTRSSVPAEKKASGKRGSLAKEPTIEVDSDNVPRRPAPAPSLKTQKGKHLAGKHAANNAPEASSPPTAPAEAAPAAPAVAAAPSSPDFTGDFAWFDMDSNALSSVVPRNKTTPESADCGAI